MYILATIVSIIALVCAVSHAGSATYVVHPNGGYIAENDFWVVSINATRVRLNAKLPWLNGGADRGAVGYEIVHWRERLRYGLSSDTAGASPCRWLDVVFPFNNWNLGVTRRTDLGGALVFTASATFGYDQMCSFTMMTYVASQSTNMTIGNETVGLTPKSLKYSFLVNCPWENLLAKNRSETLVAGTNPYNYITRRSGPLLNPFIDMEPNLALTRIGPQMFTDEIEQPPTFQIGPVWEQVRCEAYQSGIRFDGLNRLRGLWPNFDFAREQIEFTIGFEATAERNYSIIIRHNGWALSDNTKYSRADWLDSNLLFSLPPPEIITEDLYRYRIPFTQALEFVDSVLYDPSLDLLFYDNTPPIRGADATPIQMDNAYVGPAVILTTVLVPLVIVGTIAVLAYLVWKKKGVKRALLPFSARKIAAVDTLDEVEDAPIAVQAGASSGGAGDRNSTWVAGRASVSLPSQ